jgi:hypothetical protein
MQKGLPLFIFLLSFHPLRAQDDSLRLRAQDDSLRLGARALALESTGFPRQIGNSLAENIHFHFTRQSDGKDIRLKGGAVLFTLQKPRIVEWKATDSADELKMEVNAALRSGRTLSYQVKVTALQDLELKEITMHIPLQPDSVFTWKKDTTQADRAEVAVLSARTGIHYLLHGKDWGNQGRGGITVAIKGRSLLANNYSGAHSIKKGDTLEYDFDLYSSSGSIQ